MTTSQVWDRELKVCNLGISVFLSLKWGHNWSSFHIISLWFKNWKYKINAINNKAKLCRCGKHLSNTEDEYIPTGGARGKFIGLEGITRLISSMWLEPDHIGFKTKIKKLGLEFLFLLLTILYLMHIMASTLNGSRGC